MCVLIPPTEDLGPRITDSKTLRQVLDTKGKPQAMSKQHEKVVDRIIASMLAIAIEDAKAGGSDNEISASCGAAGLHRDEVRKIIMAAEKRMAKHEKSAMPLGRSARNWVAELTPNA